MVRLHINAEAQDIAVLIAVVRGPEIRDLKERLQRAVFDAQSALASAPGRGFVFAPSHVSGPGFLPAPGPGFIIRPALTGSRRSRTCRRS